MARINNKNKYPQDENVSGNDFLVGTDSITGKTKTFSIDSIIGLGLGQVPTDTAAILAGNTITFPNGDTIEIPVDTDTDTFATLNSGVITFVDGQTVNLGTIDTDTFATLSGDTLTLSDGQTYNLENTSATLAGSVITFPTGQTITVPNPSTDNQVASEVPVQTNNFSGNLQATDDTVQKALDRLDDLTLGSNDNYTISIVGSTFNLLSNGTIVSSDNLSSLVSSVSNTISGHTIATHTDGAGVQTDIAETVTTLNINANVLEYTREDGNVDTVDLSTLSGGSTTASNGLSINATTGDVELGGSLNKDTIIDLDVDPLGFTNRFLRVNNRGEGLLRIEKTIIGLITGIGNGIFSFLASGQTASLGGDSNRKFDWGAQETDALVYTGTGTSGILYSEDLSSNYVNRSLVDKEYVDNEIAANVGGGGSTTASNGLSINATTGDVELGGSLNTSTNINLNGANQFSITDFGGLNMIMSTGIFQVLNANNIQFQPSTGNNFRARVASGSGEVQLQTPAGNLNLNASDFRGGTFMEVELPSNGRPMRYTGATAIIDLPDDIPNKSYVDDRIDNVGGLRQQDDGNGIGYNLGGVDTSNNLPLGLNAIDLTLDNAGGGASGEGSFAFGVQQTFASADEAIALGSAARASAQRAVALGTSSSATGISSFAVGVDTNSNGAFAVGNNSIAIGARAEANSDKSIAIGTGVSTSSFSETCIGNFNTEYTPNSATTIDSEDKLLVVGNGTSAITRSDAFTIFKNGAVQLHPVPQSSVTNADTGMLIMDSSDSNKLKIHVGGVWREIQLV